MARIKVKLLNSTHPGYDRQLIDEHRALYEGGKRWRCMARTWITQNTKEPTDIYEDRVSRAFYINHAGSQVDLITAYLFGEAVQIEGGDKAYLERMANDCDGADTDWGTWWSELFTSAQVGGHAFVWVNLPATPEMVAVDNRATQDQLGLRDAYLVALEPEQVIDWEEDDRGRLLWIMVHGIEQRRTSPTAPRTRVHRWTHIDESVIRRWEWRSTDNKANPTPDDYADELDEVVHSIGQLPVVRLKLPAGLWAMNKLHDPAVALARRDNDLDWSLHRAAHALMVIASKWGDEEPVLGAGYYLKVGADATVGYAEPSGVSFDAQREHAEMLRQDLYRVVQQMAVSASPDAARQASGESKSRDWQAMEIVLSAYGSIVRDTMRRTLEIVHAARQEDSDGLSVKGLDSWQLEDLTTFLESALTAKPLVKSEGFAKAIAKRIVQRLLGDEVAPEVLAEILKEIDEADYEPEPLFAPLPDDKPATEPEEPDDGDDEG